MNPLPELFYRDCSNRGCLKLTGRDRQSFLQGMVTNDVISLQQGQGCYAFMLDATGHVLADMLVLNVGDYLLLDVEPGMATFVAETLEKYLIMEKCRITDVTGETSHYIVGGTAVATLIPTFGDGLHGEQAWNHREGQNIMTSLFGEISVVAGGFPIAVPYNHFYLTGETAVAYKDEWINQGAEKISEELWNALRIEAGAPRFGVDIDSRVLAPETGQQHRAINYRKGCYIGQEIVARIDARGHTNRQFAGFWLQDELLPAYNAPVIVDDKEVGRITSAAIGPQTGRPIALGYLRHEHREPGTLVTIGTQSAIVATLPFANVKA